MNQQTLETIIQGWTRLGAGFLSDPAKRTPDLERLILDTARHLPLEPRLYTATASWLCQYYELVAKHRLKVLTDDLLPAGRAQLGLLLDTVAQHTDSDHFKGVIALCKPRTPAQPLYDFQAINPVLNKLAEKQASPISRHWGLWTSPFEFKHDAIRPSSWVFKHNPSLRQRETFGGDLRATIIAILHEDSDAGSSEQKLIKTCHASRDALRRSLERLERYGHVELRRQGKTRLITLSSNRHGKSVMSYQEVS